VKPQSTAEAFNEGITAPTKGRLRLRQSTPVLPKYKGHKVDRREVFGDDAAATNGNLDEEHNDKDESELEEGGALGIAAGGFSITGELEQEYETMMKQMGQGLEIMRTPSVTEVAKRQGEAKRLRDEFKAWSALLELRIHLEGALTIGHRLPVDASNSAFCKADTTVHQEMDGVVGEVRGFLAELLALQQNLIARQGIPVGENNGALPLEGEECPPREEAEAWAAVNSRLEPVLAWGLDIGDQWKERTKLDTRRSFRVLDQSLSAQMQAFAAMDPEKLRRRCTPLPGKHKIFGSVARRAAAKAVAAAEEEERPGQDSNHGSQAELEEEQDIFDDREFYVQLLREVATGGENGGIPVGMDLTSVDTQELQQVESRRAAKKRVRADVERRASKGRKIRYVPIEKLQNFMAPRPRCGPHANGDRAEVLGDAKIDALVRTLFTGGLGPT